MGLLKQNVLLNTQLIAPEVYYRISGFEGDKNNTMYTVNAYASREAFTDGIPVLYSARYVFPTPNGNIIEAGYNLLKTVEEFSGVTDVFE